jgi:signal transduction histidine kinase
MNTDYDSRETSQTIAAVCRIAPIPALLKVLCEATGMRFAVVAAVSETTWTACVVKDDIHLGVTPGHQICLGVRSCFGLSASRTPVLIGHASADLRRSGRLIVHNKPYESCVSMPILLAEGRYFGKLCALDPSPAKVPESFILSMFTQFADLIASQINIQLLHEREHRALLDERAESELRERFIAVLGHDLRNPLQALHAVGELLERESSGTTSLNIATRIKATVRRMSGLIDDVLDFARGRLGGGVADELTEVVNVNAGLLAVVRELQEAQPDCAIIPTLAVTHPIQCNLGRLQQVASNLLSNALTHGVPKSPVTINASAEGGYLILEVWNAGAAIPPESLDKIFEPFWRHSASASRNGLGLGLHICSQIVRSYHGQISVTSSSESGTQFTVRLPLAVAESRLSLSLRTANGASGSTARQTPL